MEFLAFEFELSEALGPTEQVADCLRNVVAEFRLFVGNTVLYRDLDFPVVELVTALARWCEHVETSGQPFTRFPTTMLMAGVRVAQLFCQARAQTRPHLLAIPYTPDFPVLPPF